LKNGIYQTRLGGKHCISPHENQPMNIRTVIIDDEELGRKLIRNFLQKHPEIEIVGECANGFEGLKCIQEQNPDLLFLDIQMPKITGLEMLELLEHYPSVIFTTAYDQYAVKAFELNAVDYLLKPFSRERFDAALHKVITQMESKKENTVDYSSISDGRSDYLNRIVVKIGNKVKIILVEDVHYIEAQDDFVMIYTTDGKYLKGKTMKFYEAHLLPEDFIRVHRSYIVNAAQILNIEPYEKDSHILILRCGAKVPVSKSGYVKLKKSLRF